MGCRLWVEVRPWEGRDGEGWEDLPMACWAFLAAARPERREGILPYAVDR